MLRKSQDPSSESKRNSFCLIQNKNHMCPKGKTQEKNKPPSTDSAAQDLLEQWPEGHGQGEIVAVHHCKEAHKASTLWHPRPRCSPFHEGRPAQAAWRTRAGEHSEPRPRRDWPQRLESPKTVVSCLGHRCKWR